MGSINGIWTTHKERTSATTAGQSPSSAALRAQDSPLLETVVMFYGVSKCSEPLKPWVEFATGHIKHQWACEVAYFSVLVQQGMRRNISLAKITRLATRLLKRLPSSFGKSGDWSRLLAMILYSSLVFFPQCQLPPRQSHAESVGSDVFNS